MSRHGTDLGEALDALRSLGEGAGDPGTRERVLESLDRRGQHRRTLMSVAIVVGLSLTGTTAWGLISGWLPAVVRTITDEPPAKLTPPPPVEKRSAAAKKQRAPAPAVPPTVVVEPTVVEPPPVPVQPPPVVTPAVVARPRPRPPSVPEPAPEPSPPADLVAPPAAAPVAPAELRPVEAAPLAELRLYRVAHSAHFRGNDPERALKAWDAYLSEWPNGKLALEARWNRALVLVKLARVDAAMRALEPFAAGTAGGYRQAEARRLVEALRRGRR